MVALRAPLLGWIAAFSVRQNNGWASGETTCTSVTVSGIGDLDGTYTEISRNTFIYAARRLGGTDLFEIEQYEDTWWIFNLDRTLQYMAFDTARHPVDVTAEWCQGVNCDDGAAALQPVFTCADVPEPTPAPALSTCTSVAVSGVGDLDGTYSDTPFYSSSLDGWDYYATRNEGTETYELKGSGHLWWIRHIDGTLAYRTFDSAEHPVDITLEWAECPEGLCEYGAAASQPVITCVDTSSSSESTPAPTPSICASFTLAGAGDDLDGTYTEGAYTEQSSSSLDYYASRLEETDAFEILSVGDTWWIQSSDATLQYRTLDPAEHPVDITLEWELTECSIYCANRESPIQPVFTCAGDGSESTPSPTPNAPGGASTSASPPPTTAAEESDGTPVDGETPTPAPSADARGVQDGEVTGTDGEVEGEDGGLSTVAIVGIVAGLGAVVGGGLAFHLGCKRRQS